MCRSWPCTHSMTPLSLAVSLTCTASAERRGKCVVIVFPDSPPDVLLTCKIIPTSLLGGAGNTRIRGETKCFSHPSPPLPHTHTSPAISYLSSLSFFLPLSPSLPLSLFLSPHTYTQTFYQLSGRTTPLASDMQKILPVLCWTWVGTHDKETGSKVQTEPHIWALRGRGRKFWAQIEVAMFLDITYYHGNLLPCCWYWSLFYTMLPGNKQVAAHLSVYSKLSSFLYLSIALVRRNFTLKYDTNIPRQVVSLWPSENGC